MLQPTWGVVWECPALACLRTSDDLACLRCPPVKGKGEGKGKDSVDKGKRSVDKGQGNDTEHVKGKGTGKGKDSVDKGKDSVDKGQGKDTEHDKGKDSVDKGKSTGKDTEHVTGKGTRSDCGKSTCKGEEHVKGKGSGEKRKLDAARCQVDPMDGEIRAEWIRETLGGEAAYEKKRAKQPYKGIGLQEKERCIRGFVVDNRCRYSQMWWAEEWRKHEQRSKNTSASSSGAESSGNVPCPNVEERYEMGPESSDQRVADAWRVAMQASFPTSLESCELADTRSRISRSPRSDIPEPQARDLGGRV